MKIDREYIRLIKNVGFFLVIGIILTWGIFYFSGDDDNTPQIKDTPIHIEAVKKIAEISTVSYTDEIVVDSVEYFEEMEEISDWFDAYEITQRIVQNNVKRRLTLIVKGEIKYGYNIKDKPLQTNRSNDTLTVVVPEPELLEVNVSPSGTEVYQEQGSWSDRERRILEQKAKNKLIDSAEKLELQTKAKENAVKLFKRLLKNEKYVEIEFK